ncbi:uncharacterized protein ISCGN_028026 [Ixodes scapularis]
MNTQPIPVTRGLRQGCPLSPLLFMLYMSRWETELEECGRGLNLSYMENGQMVRQHLPGLFYADDLVLTAGTCEEMQQLLDICTKQGDRLGLKFSSRKCKVLKWGPTENVEGALDTPLVLQGETVQCVTDYKYLGVHLSTGRNYIQAHESAVRAKAMRGKEVLAATSMWAFDRYEVARSLWKMVMVPGLTFANRVLCTSSQTREFLEVRQREAGRMALGAHRGTPNEGVQGDLGWSAFESREAVAKLSYERRLCGLGEERWARRVFKYLVYRSVNTRLTKRVARLAGKYEVPPTLLDGRPLREGVADLKKHVRQVETRRWTESATRKPSMTVYAASKRAIEREQLYDDSRGSGLLFEARTGTLKTRLWRSRYDAGAPIACVACGAAEETTEHLVLQCKALSPCPQVDHLPDALGFRTAERGDDGEEHVETTKRRLEQWWEISWRLWKRERRAGPDVQAQAGQPMFSAQVDLPHTEDPTEAPP